MPPPIATAPPSSKNLHRPPSSSASEPGPAFQVAGEGPGASGSRFAQFAAHVQRHRLLGSLAETFEAPPVCPYALRPTPYTLHPAPCTLHPTPYTLQRPTEDGVLDCVGGVFRSGHEA
eukprot:31086-Rhodomonas_salina.1